MKFKNVMVKGKSLEVIGMDRTSLIDLLILATNHTDSGISDSLAEIIDDNEYNNREFDYDRIKFSILCNYKLLSYFLEHNKVNDTFECEALGIRVRVGARLTSKEISTIYKESEIFNHNLHKHKIIINEVLDRFNLYLKA